PPESQPSIRHDRPIERVCSRRPQESPADRSRPRPRYASQVVPMKVGVAKETAPGERRVALVPEVLGKLTAAGIDILVEQGAGSGAAIPDQAFADAGATIVNSDELYGQSDAILRVQKPSPSEVSAMRSG